MKTYLLAAMTAAVALATAARADDTRVLIIPFNTLNVPEAYQWIGKGVQENLVADLGRSGNVVPVAFQGSVIVEDNATAARLARKAQATLAIRGAAQVVGNDARLTAQMLDAKTGEILRTASVTGPVSGLLKLEDELTAQLRGPAPPTAAPVVASSAAPSVPSAPQQVVVVAQPAPPIYYPFPPYPPALAYPYTYGGWSTGWYPVIYSSFSGGGTSGVVIHQTHSGPDRNSNLPIPTGIDWLPLPTNNVLPIPTNNVLPLPTKSVLPLPKNNVQPLPKSGASLTPTNNVQPVPTVLAAAPQSHAGQKH